MGQKPIYENRRFRRRSICISNNEAKSVGRMAEWIARLASNLWSAGSMPLLAFAFLLIFSNFFLYFQI